MEYMISGKLFSVIRKNLGGSKQQKKTLQRSERPWNVTLRSLTFATGYKQTIQDVSTLTVQLAIEAQNIKKRILEILDVETSTGYWLVSAM